MTKVTGMIRKRRGKKAGVKDGIVVVYSPHNYWQDLISMRTRPGCTHDMLCDWRRPSHPHTLISVHGGEFYAHLKTSRVPPCRLLILRTDS